MDAQIAALIMDYAARYPTIVMILSIISMARIVMKPLFTFLHSTLENLAANKQFSENFPIILKLDAWTDAAEASPAMKAISWFFDYLFSIKVIK